MSRHTRECFSPPLIISEIMGGLACLTAGTHRKSGFGTSTLAAIWAAHPPKNTSGTCDAISRCTWFQRLAVATRFMIIGSARNRGVVMRFDNAHHGGRLPMTHRLLRPQGLRFHPNTDPRYRLASLDIKGVQPIANPVGLAYALRYYYDSPDMMYMPSDETTISSDN